MYINQKTKILLNQQTFWRDTFKDEEQFFKWCKKIVKHIKQRQFTEIYGNYFVFCNDYVQNVSEIFKKLDFTLKGFLNFLIEYKIVKQNELDNYLSSI